MSTAALVEESDALHERVLRAAERWLSGDVSAQAQRRDFDELALAIAEFQARHLPGYRRRLEAAAPANAAGLPAVPTEVFRAARIAVHPADLDAARFATSGTSGGAPGVHVFRTTETYRRLALAWAERWLRPAQGERCTVVALASDPGAECRSSLAFMMGALMDSWDGRPLSGSQAAEWVSREPARWLLGAQGLQVAALERALLRASDRREPLLLLATSFALVDLIDTLGEARLLLPDHSVVMTTGGFKGRTREVEPVRLREQVAERLGVPARRVVGEYGMTELSSQLYERGLVEGGGLEESTGLFAAPPWLRVDALDPVSLEPLPDGELGIARLIDLGNVDTAVAVLTEDLVRVEPGGVRLFGRAAGAPARGCSLAVEELLEAIG